MTQQKLTRIAKNQILERKVDKGSITNQIRINLHSENADGAPKRGGLVARDRKHSSQGGVEPFKSSSKRRTRM